MPAPSAMNSAASRQVVMPPIAEIGRPAQAGSRAISDTMESAIGFTAGPHMPPCVPLPSIATSGVIASRSIPMIELIVLMSDTASAPPFFAARAGWRMSVMLGVSLTITGMRVCALHQRATISTYSGTWPTAEPMPRSRHAVRAAEIELDAVAFGLLDAGEDRLPRLLVAGHHQRDDQRAVGPGALDLLDLLQIDLEVAVGDELDVVERDQPPVGPVDRAVARARHVDDRRPGLAERLPHHAAPAGAEGALDIDLAVGRRGGGEPERIGRLDAEEVGAEIGHGTLAFQFRRAMTPSAAAIERAACLPSSTALDRQILAAEHAVAAGPDAAKAGAPLGVDDDAAVLELDLRARRAPPARRAGRWR